MPTKIERYMKALFKSGVLADAGFLGAYNLGVWGSYVWPDATYKMERIYTNGRFWNKDDKAELKFGPGNHAKVMFVSEGNDASGLVMIGSDNMYPSPLSEFNFVIEGEEAIEAFRTQYWDRLWGYSARLGFTVKSDGNVE